MMCGWGWGGSILSILFWVALIALIISLVRKSRRGGWTGFNDEGTGSAERILKERYARGEINKEEFESKMKDVRRSH